VSDGKRLLDVSEVPCLSDRKPEDGDRLIPKSFNWGKCTTCALVGRCPIQRPLTQEELESAVRGAARDPRLTAEQRAHVMQKLASSRWQAAQLRKKQQRKRQLAEAVRARRESGGAVDGGSGSGSGDASDQPPWAAAALDEGACEPTFADPTTGAMGCKHYERSVKVYAPCCERYFPCRICHDEVSDHVLDRYKISHMLCMHCFTPQPVASTCASAKCRRRRLSRYYCETCHLFENKEGKHIYHCPFCNVCRLGRGLGIDFFHCMRCNACVSKRIKHKCVEKSLERDCPICGENLFSSTTALKVLRCGHTLHQNCYLRHARTSYTCPLCFKSLRDMTAYFRQLDRWMQRHPMPEEYRGMQSRILCNDCSGKSVVPYHFVCHKCTACGSYNTRVIDGPIRPGGAGAGADVATVAVMETAPAAAAAPPTVPGSEPQRDQRLVPTRRRRAAAGASGLDAGEGGASRHRPVETAARAPMLGFPDAVVGAAIGGQTGGSGASDATTAVDVPLAQATTPSSVSSASGSASTRSLGSSHPAGVPTASATATATTTATATASSSRRRGGRSRAASKRGRNEDKEGESFVDDLGGMPSMDLEDASSPLTSDGAQGGASDNDHQMPKRRRREASAAVEAGAEFSR